MKIYQIALGLLVFSAVATLFNEVGIFPIDVLHTGAVANASDVDQIYEIDESGGDVKTASTTETKSSILSDIADIGGGLIYFVTVIWKTLKLSLGLGSLVEMYFPGTVGEALGTMITGISYFIYGWGGMQIFRKVSSKTMD